MFNYEKKLYLNILKSILYRSKNFKLDKLIIVRELKIDNKHLMQVGKYKQWKPNIKLCIIEILNN
jgi:hypothetical protein